MLRKSLAIRSPQRDAHVFAHSLSFCLPVSRVLPPFPFARHKRAPECLAPFISGAPESWAIIVRPAADQLALAAATERARALPNDDDFDERRRAVSVAVKYLRASRVSGSCLSPSPLPPPPPPPPLFARLIRARAHTRAYARVVFNWVICSGTRRPSPCARYSAFPCNVRETKHISEIARTERHRV